MYDYTENLNRPVDDIDEEYNRFALNEDIHELILSHITKKYFVSLK
jgi:hypothetical protein